MNAHASQHNNTRDRQSPPRTENRFQLIDVLRGVSILLVIIGHYILLPNAWRGTFERLTGRDYGNIITGMGYYGVALFFVISGYLITSLSLRRYGRLDRVDFSDFYWRRFARIMPMLLLCMVMMLLYHFLQLRGFVFSSELVLKRSVTSLLSFRFYEMMNQDHGLGAWNALWSLSVEEAFYLSFPFLCLALGRKRTALWMGSIVISAAIYMRLCEQANNYCTTGCMDLLALGCVTAILRPERLRERLSPLARQGLGLLLCAAGLANLLYIVLRYHPFDVPIFGALFCGCSAVALIVAARLLDLGRTASLLLLPLSFLGVISYEVYLLHMPVHIYFVETFKWINDWHVLLVFPLAWLVHVGFSEPINQRLRAGAAGRPLGSSTLRFYSPRLGVIVVALLSLAALARLARG
jgi:peptidoglycan/LPS O-acetylase OafA/YrhL